MAYIHTSTLTDTSTVTFDERDGSESGSGGPVFVNFSLSEAITDDYTSIKVTPDEPNEDIDIYIYRTTRTEHVFLFKDKIRQKSTA